MKAKIIKELEKQEKILGYIPNKDLILKILDSVQYESEFFALIQPYFHRYGKLSYESHRFYRIKPYILPLFDRSLNSL